MQGVTSSSATFVYFTTAIDICPGIGYLMDRVGHKRLIIGLGGLLLAVLMVLVPGGLDWILVLMLLIGIAQTMVPAPIFALLPEVTRPARLGQSYGVLATCLNIGIAFGPSVTGFIRDLTGSHQVSYALMSGLALLVSVTMLTLRQREQPPA
jgi:MFS family permease